MCYNINNVSANETMFKCYTERRMDIAKKLTEEFPSVKPDKVQNIINLIDEGNTIPFIARYRKEMPGSCDDQVLREFNDRLAYLRNLEKRKEEVAGAIEEQGKMTDEIKRRSMRQRPLQRWRIFTARTSRRKRPARALRSKKDCSPWRNLSLRRIKMPT